VLVLIHLWGAMHRRTLPKIITSGRHSEILLMVIDMVPIDAR
jgi:hypothetical protein